MPLRAFANEDGNLQIKSLVTTRNRTYSDIDLTFQKKPSGDVYKKTDAAAVKQAVKNILLTNYSEKPFVPRFGADLNSILFDLDTELDQDIIQQLIITTVEDFEPRAKILDIQTSFKPNNNAVDITVTFQILNTGETVVVDVTLTRLR